MVFLRDADTCTLDGASRGSTQNLYANFRGYLGATMAKSSCCGLGSRKWNRLHLVKPLWA